MLAIELWGHRVKFVYEQALNAGPDSEKFGSDAFNGYVEPFDVDDVFRGASVAFWRRVAHIRDTIPLKPL